MSRVGAKHAAVARLWLQRPGTRRTVVHDDTAISRHDFARTVPAMRAGQRRVQISHSICQQSNALLSMAGPDADANYAIRR